MIENARFMGISWQKFSWIPVLTKIKFAKLPSGIYSSANKGMQKKRDQMTRASFKNQGKAMFSTSRSSSLHN